MRATSLPVILSRALASYRASLELEFPDRVRRVVLFGSVARGEATEDSDVDVLVVIDRLAFTERSRAIDLGTQAGLDHDLALSPMVLSQSEWDALVERERRIAREIERDGVPV